MKPVVILSLLALLLTQAVHSVELNRQQLESWADTAFDTAFERKQFSGLVIAVVQNDQVLFTKGYGYADFAKQTPVLPEQTRFRIGSNTKTYTATAIMQLLDQGLIESLDDPANKYLQRTQLDTSLGVITLWDLLTHRAGFEDRAWGLGNYDAKVSIPATSEEIAERMQPVVRPPGERSVYCNFCTALLGAIVEDVTGETFQSYLTNKVLLPLDMKDSELVYKTRPSANEGVSYGLFPNGDAQAVSYLSVHPFIAPAGALSMTALDMTKYMRAHLDAGKTHQNPILSPESFAIMHTRHAGNHPATPGFGAKFIVGEWNGQTTFEHAGGWPGFESIMTMLPDSNLGFFIAVMSNYPNVGLLESLLGSERTAVKEGEIEHRPLNLFDLRQAFMFEFLGPYRPTFDTNLTLDNNLNDYYGTYWHQRRSYFSFEAFLDLLDTSTSVREVTPDGEGGLAINGRGGYQQVEPDVFFKPRDSYSFEGEPWVTDIYAFTKDANGVPQHLDTFGPDTFQRASNFWNPAALSPLMLFGLLGCLLGLLAVIWPKASGQAALAKTLTISLGLFPFAAAFVLLGGFAEGDALVFDLLGQKPIRFIAFSSLTTYVAIASVLLLWISVQAWRLHYWGNSARAVFARVNCTLVALVSALLIPVFWFANLIGWHMPWN